MWKRIFSSGIGWLFAVCVLSAEGDAVLLRVNGESITADEFEHYRKRHAAYRHRPTLQQYWTDFLRFKLKVADAQEHRWDTLPDFKRQFAALRQESEDRRKQFAPSRAESDWVCLSCLTVPLSQRATAKEEAEARMCMDSVCSFLKQGGAWEDAAARFPAKVHCTKEVWQPEVCLLNEFKEQVSALSKGAFSAPFFSPLGLHVVRYEGKERRRGLSGSGLPPAMEGEAEEQMYLKELHDGLLVSYWDRKVRILPDSMDEKELDRYFRHHRERYDWEFPHFKGAVIHCTSKKAASKLRKRLKKVPVEQWQAALDRLEKEDTLYRAEMEAGLFRIGSNVYVDYLSFKCGERPVHPRFSYSFVMGKRLKKGPETLYDVYERVVEDFRREQEDVFFQTLMRRFQVEIRQDVLKTVNCGKNKEE